MGSLIKHLLFSAAGAGLLATLAGGAHAQSLVERGKYLVEGALGCANCHTQRNPDGSLKLELNYAGGFEFNEEPAFHSYSRNITPDPDTGIGNWTDEEIIVAIREGKTREGEIIGPPMPIATYNNMSDEDVEAVVAYLRSLPPIRNEVPDSEYNIPVQAMPPAKGDPAPPPEDKVAYGGYIVNALAHCFECHTPLTEAGTPDLSRLGAGGFPIRALGIEVHSANITPDKETGIGEWTDEELKAAIMKGEGAHDSAGRPLFPVMPYPFFQNMTEADVEAVIAYLRTIPPVVNEVERKDWREQLPPPPQQ